MIELNDPASIDGDPRTTAELAAELAAATKQRERIERAARPGTAELAAIGRPGTVRASARAGSRAHLAELTEPQLRVLWAADNPAGAVSQNGSTGVTRPLIRALDAKGYGRAMYHAQRRHLIIGFEINDRGRKAARERFGMPTWAGPHDPLVNVQTGLCYRNVERPNGTIESCGEPARSPIHDPAAYLAYATKLTAELDKWKRGEGEYAALADSEHVHPFTD